jgi:hypothetical protein
MDTLTPERECIHDHPVYSPRFHVSSKGSVTLWIAPDQLFTQGAFVHAFVLPQIGKAVCTWR